MIPAAGATHRLNSSSQPSPPIAPPDVVAIPLASVCSAATCCCSAACCSCCCSNDAPTLGLFGPTDDTLYAPWGDHCAVIRAEPFAAFKGRDPQLNLPEPHMASLSLDSVQGAALSLLARTEGAQP